MPLAMIAFGVLVMLILEEQVFVTAVYGECDGCGAETWESTSESIKSGEGTRVSPLLSVQRRFSSKVRNHQLLG